MNARGAHRHHDDGGDDDDDDDDMSIATNQADAAVEQAYVDGSAGSAIFEADMPQGRSWMMTTTTTTMMTTMTTTTMPKRTSPVDAEVATTADAVSGKVSHWIDNPLYLGHLCEAGYSPLKEPVPAKGETHQGAACEFCEEDCLGLARRLVPKHFGSKDAPSPPRETCLVRPVYERSPSRRLVSDRSKFEISISSTTRCRAFDSIREG